MSIAPRPCLCPRRAGSPGRRAVRSSCRRLHADGRSLGQDAAGPEEDSRVVHPDLLLRGQCRGRQGEGRLPSHRHRSARGRGLPITTRSTVAGGADLSSPSNGFELDEKLAEGRMRRAKTTKLLVIGEEIDKTKHNLLIHTFEEEKRRQRPPPPPSRRPRSACLARIAASPGDGRDHREVAERG